MVSVPPDSMGRDRPPAASSGAAEELARALRGHRKAAGLSQAQLAAQVGYTRQYVSNAERASVGLPSAELVHAIDTALGANGTLTTLHSRAQAERRSRRKVAKARTIPQPVASTTGEIVATYPYRSNMPTNAWRNLIDSTKHHIDLLGYTLYFLALDHPELVPELQEKCANGCRVRAIVADPRSKHVADRDREEAQPITLAARISTTMKYFRPLRDCEGFEMRYQDVPLYNSVFRFDDQMLVTPHLFATPGSSAPMLHLRRLAPNGMFSRFTKHFEDIWSVTADIPDESWT